jgi:hypothetical protein
MGNGALPHGPSDRAHPRLYLLGPREMSDLSPKSELKQTLSRHRRMTESDPKADMPYLGRYPDFLSLFFDLAHSRVDLILSD